MERRDYASRAARTQTVLELLASHVDGVVLAELAAVVPAAIAGRILKPLAIKGLVKVVADQWRPSPALLLGRDLDLQRE